MVKQNNQDFLGAVAFAMALAYYMCEIWQIRTRITKKRKKFTVSHELRTCESGFTHCTCEDNSPAKKLLSLIVEREFTF